MKVLKTLAVFGIGAAVGYALANNRIELNVSIDPIVEKVKNTISSVMNQGEVIEAESCESEETPADESENHNDNGENYFEDQPAY